MNRSMLARRGEESEPPRCVGCRANDNAGRDSPAAAVFVAMVLIVSGGIDSVVGAMCPHHHARYMDGLARTLAALAEKANREALEVERARLLAVVGPLLRPLEATADAWDNDDLDAGELAGKDAIVETEGGRALVTIEDCRRARDFLRGR